MENNSISIQFQFNLIFHSIQLKFSFNIIDPLIEPFVSHSASYIADIRNETVNKLWTETYKLNVLYKENWTAMAVKEIEHFQRVLVRALKDGHSPGDEYKFYSRWSFTDSWVYSISIITTIGMLYFCVLLSLM